MAFNRVIGELRSDRRQRDIVEQSPESVRALFPVHTDLAPKSQLAHEVQDDMLRMLFFVPRWCDSRGGAAGIGAEDVVRPRRSRNRAAVVHDRSQHI